MSTNIINLRDYANPAEELDKMLIPERIYQETLNRNTEAIQNYFFNNNPSLMLAFVGFNSKLKFAERMLSERKCSCFYTVPWITKYQVDNNKNKTILLFNQLIQLYDYMIRYWYPSKEMSNLRYLSQISLSMLNDMKRFVYNINNNLDCSAILCKSYLRNNLKNNRDLMIYINQIVI